MYGELDVSPPGLHPHPADDKTGGVAHALVLLVAQRLGRGDSDAVPCMDAHRVEVLDGADDDEVVSAVAHHLQFVLLPAQDRLLHQDLIGRAFVQSPGSDLPQLVWVVGQAAAAAAQGEGRAHNDRVAHFVSDGQGFLDGIGQPAAGHGEPDFSHGLLEQEPVLGQPHGLDPRTDEAYAVAVQHPGIGQGDSQIERRLPAHRGQQGIGSLSGDDSLQHGDGEGFDVGAVGHLGIGHDGGRVGVNQHYLIALGPQRLARLRARVVELTGLPDDDGAGADNQNLVDVGALGHCLIHSSTHHPSPSLSSLQTYQINISHHADPVTLPDDTAR